MTFNMIHESGSRAFNGNVTDKDLGFEEFVASLREQRTTVSRPIPAPLPLEEFKVDRWRAGVVQPPQTDCVIPMSPKFSEVTPTSPVANIHPDLLHVTSLPPYSLMSSLIAPSPLSNKSDDSLEFVYGNMGPKITVIDVDQIPWVEDDLSDDNSSDHLGSIVLSPAVSTVNATQTLVSPSPSPTQSFKRRLGIQWLPARVKYSLLALKSSKPKPSVREMTISHPRPLRRDL